MQQAVEPLGVIHEEAYAVVGRSGQTIVAAEVELPLDVAQAPVAFAWVKEVDAEAGDHVAAVGILLPVEGEGVEVVVAEVEHGVDLVLYALAQPALYILVYGLEGVPAARGVAGGVVVLAHGAAAHLDPRLQCLDRLVEGADDFADVIPAPLGQGAPMAVAAEELEVGEAVAGPLGVAQVVEVHPIDIVALHNLFDEALQVEARIGVAGVEEVFALIGGADGRLLAPNRLGAEAVDMLAAA